MDDSRGPRRPSPSIETRRVYWFYILPTVLAVCWQVIAVLQGGRISASRGAALGIGIAILAWCVRFAPKRKATLVTRALIACLSSGLFWLSLLQVTLRLTTVLALGFLFFVTAGVIHACMLFWVTRPSGGDSRLGKIVLEAGFSLSVLAVFLFGVEGVFRIFFPPRIYAPLPDNPAAGSHLTRTRDGLFVGRPGFRGTFVHPEFSGIRVEMNDYGLRDSLDEATPPAAGEASVLVLGDSFAYGTGVELEETFQEVLEARRKDITAQPLRVYGAGVPGYGTLHELQLLRELAPRTRPQVVIVAVFEQNDFQDNWSAEKQAAARTSQKAERENSESERLALGGSLRSRFQSLSATSSSMLVARTQVRPLLFRLGLINRVDSEPFLDQFLLLEPPNTVEETRDSVITQLMNIRGESEKLQADLVLLLIPAAAQSDTDRFEQLLSLKAAGERAGFSRTAFHQDFVARLRHDNFLVVDMLPHLEREFEAGRDCYLKEGHWNARGHALAAENLVPVLAKLLAKQEASINPQ